MVPALSTAGRSGCTEATALQALWALPVLWTLQVLRALQGPQGAKPLLCTSGTQQSEALEPSRVQNSWQTVLESGRQALCLGCQDGLALVVVTRWPHRQDPTWVGSAPDFSGSGTKGRWERDSRQKNWLVWALEGQSGGQES